eukprot:5761311-Pleurochrysis_carterae.AAC.1
MPISPGFEGICRQISKHVCTILKPRAKLAVCISIRTSRSVSLACIHISSYPCHNIRSHLITSGSPDLSLSPSYFSSAFAPLRMRSAQCTCFGPTARPQIPRLNTPSTQSSAQYCVKSLLRSPPLGTPSPFFLPSLLTLSSYPPYGCRDVS